MRAEFLVQTETVIVQTGETGIWLTVGDTTTVKLSAEQAFDVGEAFIRCARAHSGTLNPEDTVLNKVLDQLRDNAEQRWIPTPEELDEYQAGNLVPPIPPAFVFGEGEVAFDFGESKPED